jgi:hypothetical protein
VLSATVGQAPGGVTRSTFRTAAPVDQRWEQQAVADVEWPVVRCIERSTREQLKVRTAR